MTDPVMEALEQTKRQEALAAVRRAERKLQEAKEQAAALPYTVADLIADLRRFDPEAQIEAEGCDCYRRVTAVEPDGHNVSLRTESGGYLSVAREPKQLVPEPVYEDEYEDELEDEWCQACNHSTDENFCEVH